MITNRQASNSLAGTGCLTYRMPAIDGVCFRDRLFQPQSR